MYAEASYFLENEWGCKIPKEVIENGLPQKARFGHMSSIMVCVYRDTSGSQSKGD